MFLILFGKRINLLNNQNAITKLPPPELPIYQHLCIQQTDLGFFVKYHWITLGPTEKAEKATRLKKLVSKRIVDIETRRQTNKAKLSICWNAQKENWHCTKNEASY